MAIACKNQTSGATTFSGCDTHSARRSSQKFGAFDELLVFCPLTALVPQWIHSPTPLVLNVSLFVQFHHVDGENRWVLVFTTGYGVSPCCLFKLI